MSSLKERARQRHEQLQQDSERTFVLDVPGYEDVGLAARYKAIPYETLKKIEAAVERERPPTDAEREQEVSARALCHACVGLLEKTGEDDRGRPQYRELGHGWTAAGIRDSLGIDVPEETTNSRALRDVFAGTIGGARLILHFASWDAKASEVNQEVEEALLGESRPSEAVSSPSEPTPA